MAKAQRVLSIEIGYSMTQVCEMDYQSKHPKLYGVFSMKTPDGVIDDGYVKVNDDFVMQLKSNLSANGMAAKKVMFVVSSTKIANREAKIPAVKEKQIKDLVMSNVTDYFPVDPTMYRFAYTIMDTVTDESGNKQHHLMLMAAPSDMLEGYVALAKALDLEFDSIDYSGNSIFQALKTKFSQGVNLTVKIDERSSLITVTNNGVITMQRAGMYGADQVVDVLVDSDVYGSELSYDAAVRTLRRNNLVMRPEEEDALAQREQEAEQIAKEHAVTLEKATASGDHRNMAAATVAAKQADANLKMLRLRRDVTYSYQQLINSIVRVIDYYNSRNRDASIDKIILTGIAADFWGFSNLLSEELGREVEVLRDLAGTNIIQGLHLQDVSLGDYITVIGASLSTTGFTPASIERAAKGAKAEKGGALGVSKDQLPVVVFGVCTVAAIILLVWRAVPFVSAKMTNTDLLNKKRELAPVQDIYREYQQTQADYNYLMAVYAQTENYNRGLYELVEMLEKEMPSVADVTSLTAQAEDVTINVDVLHKRAAAQLVMNLREIEYFSDVNLTSITKAEDQNTGEEYFTTSIVCTYGANPYISTDENAEGIAEETDAVASEQEE
ncbi:MAG: hypothetical protein IJ711_12925 [Lachnospiraceae bacterium]|nr:hypothetical protein [Lachnospiraceae bacterium]